MSRSLTALLVLSACGSVEPGPSGGSPEAGSALRATERSPAALRPELHWQADPATTEVDAPMQLTASDGTGLRLRAMEIQSVVQGPLAFTELHLTFDNPEARTLEGRFEITLPPGAAIGRFAMKIGDRWQEGEVVETQAARRAYEDFLHRRQDPALMEKDAGNQFRARVFPIPPLGTKELIVSYSHELGGGQPYEVLLRGLPQLDRLDARILVEGAAEPVVVSERDFVPDRDLRVSTPSASDGEHHLGLRSGGLHVVRLHPRLDVTDDPVDALTVLVDTSASRAIGFEDAMTRLARTLAELAEDQGGLQVDVLAFDQELVPVYRGDVSGFSPAPLVARGALGASDLEHALEQLVAHDPYERLLLVTDGVATAGSVEPSVLRGSIRSLEQAGVQRVDVQVDGGIRDAALLAELVTAGLPDDGVVFDADDDATDRLTRATRSGIEVSVPGAAWVWPDTLNGLQSGDEVLVYAEVPAGEPLTIELHGAQLAGSLQVASTSRPLLARAAAQARIRRLEHLRARSEDATEREDLRQQIIDVSVTERVLSDHTSLLVLETEADYQRYDILRRGLADILVVGERGLEVRERGEEAVPLPVVQKPATGKKSPKQKLDRASAMFDDDDWAPMASDALQTLGYTEAEVASEPPPMGAPPPPPAIRAAPASSPRPALSDPFDAPAEEQARVRAEGRPGVEDPRPEVAVPWTGPLAEVMALLAEDRADEALERALLWRAEDPGDVLALLALGEAYTALGDTAAAARAYGSILDLFPSRADLRRMAGERLEALPAHGLALAVDTFGKALEQRPDHPSSHRLYAYALVQQERYDEAFSVVVAAHQRDWTSGRFAGADRILAEDVGLVGAALKRAVPERGAEVDATVAEVGGVAPEGRTLRFVLYWETDANDVDFHIYDGRSGHAYYSSPTLGSGGQLYADVTTGYGPECFTIEDADAFPYTLQAHYYSRGPMGYGMGTLQTLAHDGEGRLEVSSRPFVIMKDGATVDLGVIEE